MTRKEKTDLMRPLVALEIISFFIQIGTIVAISLLSWYFWYWVFGSLLGLVGVLSSLMVCRVQGNGHVGCRTKGKPDKKMANKIFFTRVVMKVFCSLLGLFLWTRSYLLYIDIEGGEGFGFTSLNGKSSCWGGDFLLNPETQECESSLSGFTPEQMITYNPKGVFPTKGQTFTPSGIWSGCYLNQSWGMDVGVPNQVTPFQYLNGQLQCESSLAPLSVSIPGCNGPLCPLGYPTQNFGLLLSPLEPLLPLTPNQTGKVQLCPGIKLGLVSYWALGGERVPQTEGGAWILPPSYLEENQTPLPLCPACLWFWMTQQAGTPDNPYQSPQMDLLLQTCMGKQGPGKITQPPATYQNSPWFCWMCPLRGEKNPNVPSHLAQMEIYSKTNLVAVFWLWTSFVFFEPVGWMILFYILRPEFK